MQKKKISFLQAFVLYHALWVLIGVLLRKKIPPLFFELMWEFKVQTVLLFTGGFLFVYGLIKIIHYEFVHRPGRRLLAKEAELKRKGIDFDQIRKKDGA